MSGRADHARPRLGAAVATVSLSVVAFCAAVTAVFLALMWGRSLSANWGVALGMLLPIGMTLLAAALLAGHFVRLRLARSAAIRKAIDRELDAILKTDRG